MKNDLSQQNMKSLLKAMKSNRDLFKVPEPDAGFEKRLMKSLHESAEWKRSSWLDTWRNSWETLFKIEINTWRFAGATLVAVLAFGGLKIFDNKQTSVVVQSTEATSRSVFASMMNQLNQTGGAKALQAWAAINGDMGIADTSTADTTANNNITEEEQKRILAELEKKWAPAL